MGVTVVQDVPLCKQCKYGRDACARLGVLGLLGSGFGGLHTLVLRFLE